MNNILATGESRYLQSTSTTYINFDNESVITGQYAGDDLKIANSTTLGINYNNTFVGFKAGQFTKEAIRNVFIGAEAGINTNGSNNIILGTNYNDGTDETLYDSLSIGYYNKTSTNSISIGKENESKGYDNILLGLNQYVKGKRNTLIGFENWVTGNSNIIHGIDNNVSNSHNSIVIGNRNLYTHSNINSNYLIIGNDNYIPANSISSNGIYIGNNVKTDNISLNIGNTMMVFDNTSNREIIVIGKISKYGEYSNIVCSGYETSNSSNSSNCSTFVDNILHTAIGYNINDIPELDTFIDNTSNHYGNLYVKHGIYTPKLTLGNHNEEDISIRFVLPNKVSSNIDTSNIDTSNIDTSNIDTSNIDTYYNSNLITYTLPLLPDDTNNVVLSTNSKGELYWTKVDANVDKIYSLLPKNSDQIAQGSSNLYWNADRVDTKVTSKFLTLFPSNFENAYNAKLQVLNLDQINDGTSNNYIHNGVYNKDLYICGTLTVNKLQVLGVDIKNESSLNNYISNIIQNTSNDLLKNIDDLQRRLQLVEQALGISTS